MRNPRYLVYSLGWGGWRSIPRALMLIFFMPWMMLSNIKDGIFHFQVIMGCQAMVPLEERCSVTRAFFLASTAMIVSILIDCVIAPIAGLLGFLKKAWFRDVNDEEVGD